MQGYTRRQLKEDRFAETAKDAADWASGHRRTVVWAIAIVVVVAAAVGGFFFLQSRQSEQANIALKMVKPPKLPAGFHEYPQARLLCGTVALFEKNFADAEKFYEPILQDFPNGC